MMVWYPLHSYGHRPQNYACHTNAVPGEETPFRKVTVVNNEPSLFTVYFFIKPRSDSDSVQYKEPVLLQPRDYKGDSVTIDMPVGAQIDARIQYYTQWCRKIWGSADIASNMELSTTTREIGRSNCQWGVWVTRGVYPEPIRPEYLALGLTKNNPTAYEILGVLPNATQQQITAAYRNLGLKWHPDKYKGENKDFATEVFKVIGNAYQELANAPAPGWFGWFWG